MATLLRSIHWPRLFVAVAVAGIVLGVASAASSLFLSSAANAMLRSELAVIGDHDAGLTARIFGRVDLARYQTFERELYETVTPIDRLGEPRATAIGTALAAGKPNSSETARMRLFYRDEALQNVERMAGEIGDPGVWMPHTAAGALGLDVDDELEIEYGTETRRTTIAGIYRALNTAPITDYWRPLTFEIVNLRDFDLAPPPFLIAEKDTFFELGSGLTDEAEMVWHFPLTAGEMNYDESLALERRYDVAHHAGDDPLSPLGRAYTDLRAHTFQVPSIDSLMFSLIERIKETVTSLDTSVRVLGFAGQAVALFAIGGAGLFLARSRHTELRSMLAQGITPTGIGATFATEMALPTILGVGLGYSAAIGLVRALGPGAHISLSAYESALVASGIAAIIALAALGAVVATSARREIGIGFARARRIAVKIPWEALVLLLAVAGYYELATGRRAIVTAPGEAPEIDLLVLTFPLLFISGVVGLAARVSKRLLPRLRDRGPDRSTALYLTWRRLADSSATAVMLMAVTAMAIGVLMYAATVVRSIEDTVSAKAYIATGSDVAVTVPRGTETQATPFPVTQVTRLRGDIFPGDENVDVVAVDRATFASAAFWDPRFSSASLDDLLARMASGDERLPALVAGIEVGDRATLVTAETQVPLEVIDRPLAFPGTQNNTPIVVVGRERFMDFIEASGNEGLARVVAANELWAKGDPATILDHFNDAGIVLGSVRDTRDFLAAGPLRAVTWTFSLMEALGLLAAMMVVIGLVFYLESRQREREISYGLARRMGLRSRDHRLALAAELGGMVTIALCVGTLAALGAARLVLSHADPLASMPPPVLFRVPLTTLLVVIPAGALICAIAAWRVQRTADRVRMAEVMRVAA